MGVTAWRHASRHTYVSAALAILGVIALLVPVFYAQGLAWSDAAVTTLCFVLSGALTGWAAWQVLMRRPAAASMVHALVRHVATGLVFALAWTLVFAGSLHLIYGPASGGLSDELLWQVVWGLGIYAALAQAARMRARLREEELATTRAELVALRAQLNPHFLFNTLHSLTQLAREDPAGTQQALERFGDLMRYVLRSGADAAAEVTLEEELEFVDHYLALEQLRLGERLRVARSIDPDTLELALPPLLLQPLVENAVRHGVAPRREGGTVRLTTQMVEERLLIEVADDGDGGDANAWRQSEGLGLRSVVRQLQARYATTGELDVRTRRGHGFAVRIAIPARVPPVV